MKKKPITFEYNNEPVCEFLTPSLSSISQPIEQIGKESVRLLLQQIEAKEGIVSKQVSVLDTTLIVRESSIRTSNQTD